MRSAKFLIMSVRGPLILLFYFISNLHNSTKNIMRHKICVLIKHLHCDHLLEVCLTDRAVWLLLLQLKVKKRIKEKEIKQTGQFDFFVLLHKCLKCVHFWMSAAAAAALTLSIFSFSPLSSRSFFALKDSIKLNYKSLVEGTQAICICLVVLHGQGDPLPPEVVFIAHIWITRRMSR